jgi:asparagine synthase (glutamine-hydrolysing)
MSGFVGFVNTLGDGATDVVATMLDAIAHRGPDGNGVFVDEQVALGACWLETLTAGATQPIANECGSRLLVYDGEIYNHASLREELEAAGHTFATPGDGEVVLHGYTQWGADELLGRLRGKFAFVIWDAKTRTFFGAHDPFGVKPLYYYADETIDGVPFLFASEIKAMLHHPRFKKVLATDALPNYLSFQYSVTDETFFKGVKRLRAGHYFTWNDGVFEATRYWRPTFNAVEGSIEQYADRIDAAVDEAVALHTQAADGVEVGSFLSSGVDSSYIASKADVDKTFTVGFESELFNETDYASEFAEVIGVKNTRKVITADEYFDELGHIQYHMDEPLADPAAIGLFFAAQLAAQDVKVVLSGEGADELFGGYGVYREPLHKEAMYHKLPAPIWHVAGILARPLYALFPRLPGRDFIMRRNKPLEEWFIGGADIFSVAERAELLKVGGDAPTPQQVTAPYYAEVADADEVTRMQYLDLHLWSPGDILLKADRMTSANSLEVRSPLLDREVMAIAEEMPRSAKVDTEQTKKAFRSAAARTLPLITAQKPKLGFPVPIRVWLKEDAYYDRVKDAFTGPVAEQLFHTDKLVKLLDDHRSGAADNSRKIWTVFMFLVWYDEFFDKR